MTVSELKRVIEMLPGNMEVMVGSGEMHGDDLPELAYVKRAYMYVVGLKGVMREPVLRIEVEE